MFHDTIARFKQMVLVRGAIAAPKTSSTDTTDETSSAESLCEFVEDIGATIQPQVSDTDTATIEKRHDSVLDPTKEQAATSSMISTLTPRPQRKDLRRSLEASGYFKPRPNAPCTSADETSGDDDENGKMWLARERARMYDGLARFNVCQQQVDQMRADLDVERAAREAQEFAATQARAWEAQIRAAREQRQTAEQRLTQQIVAEVVPRSASGRAHGDVAEIRRCAATKVGYQMVPDGNYPQFRPSS